MSSGHFRAPRLGVGRLTLIGFALLAGILGYPWSTTIQRVVLVISIVVLTLLLGRVDGLPLTTMLERRLALLRSRPDQTVPSCLLDRDISTTVVLKIHPQSGSQEIPVDLISTYLDRYRLEAKMIRIITSYRWETQGVCAHDTWIGLTYSALTNLTMLQARSGRIPLEETAEIATRRLADHLRELGWIVTVASSEDLPEFTTGQTEETWQSLRDQSHHYTTVYQLNTNTTLADTLDHLHRTPAQQMWTVIELTGSSKHPNLAVACIIHTDTTPDYHALSQAGLVCQRGYQRTAVSLLGILSPQQLPHHRPLTSQQLDQLRIRLG